MNELQGLLIPTKGQTCTILDSAIACPRGIKDNSLIQCSECVFNISISKVHPKLIELIPILLLEDT